MEANSTNIALEIWTRKVTMSMITATAWVPRGFAAPFPTKYTFDEEEFQRIAELAKLQLDDANEDLEEARKQTTDSNGGDVMAEEERSGGEVAAEALKSKGSAHSCLVFSALLLIFAVQRRGRR